MPQSERSETIKEFLRWITAKSLKGGASLYECIEHLRLEISEMGALKTTAKRYVDDCVEVGFVEIKGMKYIITEKGKSWLRRKAL